MRAAASGSGAAIAMAWIDSTIMPSTVEAAAAVPRVEKSVACTAAAVVEAGTAMVAVISTLAAVMAIVTAEASTPTTAAIELPMEVFVVSSKSLTLPLAVIVSTTDGGSGGNTNSCDLLMVPRLGHVNRSNG